MIIGIGIDISEQERIRASITQFGQQFVEKLFTTQEINYCERYRDPTEHYAGKFAVKEAFMKAIGTGRRQQVTFKDIEVLNQSSGAPRIILHGNTKVFTDNLGIMQIHVSVSHSADIAVAVVILEGMPKLTDFSPVQV